MMTPSPPVSKSQLGASPVATSSERRLVFFRALFIVCLLAVCGAGGYAAYSQTYYYEGTLGTSQFKSIADQFETFVHDNLKAKVLALDAQASIIAMTCPHASMWPNCSIPWESYLNISDPVIQLTKMRTLSYAVMVKPEEVSSFEAFAYDFYESEGYGHLGISPFGKGIFALNATTRARYHDTQGIHTGKRQVLIPVLQSGEIDKQNNQGAIMYNIYSEPVRSITIDGMIDCVEAGNSINDCAYVTDNIVLVQDILLNRPAVLILHPVTPRFNKTTLTGYVVAVTNWETVFMHALPNYILGVDVVLSGGTKTYTFRIDRGIVEFSKNGDHHESSHESSKQSFNIDLFRGTYRYNIAIYPTDEFANQYRTSNPWIAMGVTVGIMVLTAAFFFLYDLFMNRNSVEKELRTAINTKRLFVRFISHEIRTPMNTVSLGLKLLEMEIQAILKQPGHSALMRDAMTSWIQLVDDIHGNGDSAVDVLNDLLNYDKIESGTLRLEFSTVDIWTLVKKTAAAFVMQAKQKNIDLQLIGDCWSTTLSYDETAVYGQLRVIGDATRIAQVLRNLLSNALKFTPENGRVIVQAAWVPNGLPYATLAVPEEQSNLLDKPRAGSVKVTVTDSGAGLSDKQLAQICTEGTQFNANQLQAGGGSGLGLFISKGLAEQHGGGILVSSEGLGKGSTFRVELPLFRHDEDNFTPMGSMRTKPMHRSESGSSGTGSGKGLGRKLFNANGPSKVVPVDEELENIEEEDHDHQMSMSYHMPERARRVLVIDDATSNRKLLIRILKAKGYVCDEAEDGQKGLDLYVSLRRQGEIIDAILMDFEMPVMDGPTATKKLREYGCNCFIVGVTGNLLPADIDLFRRQGANSVLAKPLNVDVFETTFKSFRAVPDTDRFNSLLATTSSTTNLGQEEYTAKLHPLGGASNV